MAAPEVKTRTHAELLLASTQLFAKSKETIRQMQIACYQSRSVRARSRFLLQHKPGTTLYIKECACGAEYTPSQWERLPLVGYQSIGRLDAELRDCECKSTLSLIIERRPE